MANNPLDKVYLSQANLTTIAEGGSISSGDDSYSADENAIYLVPDETGDVVQTTGQSTTDIMSQKAVTDAINTAISTVYKIQGSSNISALNGLTKSQSMNGYVYDLTDSGNLTNQDSTTLSVSIGDNVVFIWNDGSWKWDKLAGTIDLSGYVQKTTTIAGIALSADISAQTLTDSLTYATSNDIKAIIWG